MFMPQTLKDYLDNPMGKGSTAIMNRQLIKDALNKRYEKLIKENKNFKYTIYYDRNDFYFHFIIPSESERNNTYDVIIQFTEGEENFKSDINLNRYYLKFFSNCPSFTYTFAYVYNDYDLLIDFLKNKYEDKVIDDNPVTRNPGEIISFEKSIYFACKYLETHKILLNKMSMGTAKKLNKKELYDIIRSNSDIMLEIKKEENRLRNEKKKDKEDKERKNRRSTTSGTKIRGEKRKGVNVIKASKKIKPRKKIGEK